MIYSQKICKKIGHTGTIGKKNEMFIVFEYILLVWMQKDMLNTSRLYV